MHFESLSIIKSDTLIPTPSRAPHSHPHHTHCTPLHPHPTSPPTALTCHPTHSHSPPPPSLPSPVPYTPTTLSIYQSASQFCSPVAPRRVHIINHQSLYPPSLHIHFRPAIQVTLTPTSPFHPTFYFSTPYFLIVLSLVHQIYCPLSTCSNTETHT